MAQNNSLTNFSFDDENDDFATPGTKKTKDLEEIIKEVKGEDDDFDDDFPETKLPAKVAEAVNKGKTKIEKREGEEDDSEEDWGFDDDKTKVKPKVETTTKPKEEVKGTKEKVKGEETKDEEDEENIEFEGDDSKGKDNEIGEDYYTNLVLDLKDKGILNIEIEEGKQYTEDEFFELHDAEIEARAEDTLGAFVEDMDDEGKAFIKFKKAGGKTSDFKAHIIDTSFDLEELDENNEKDVDKVIKYYLKVIKKNDEDEIEDIMASMKERGKKKGYAIKYFDKIKENRETTLANIVKAQEAINKQKEDNVKEFTAVIKSVLKDKDKINGFAITSKDITEIPDYINKPTVKQGKKFIPAFQADLNRVLTASKKGDLEDFITLAKLLKNRFEVKDIIAKVQTTVATKVKDAIDSSRKNNRRVSSSGGADRKPLADFFPD